ncbi:PQ loop repeat-domain-containing protein [Amylocarpus encephaloides]|uniref:PQ loop repeat-domain-containing protein n=1 Tax=Amylocarpus encephaloides TaxID=45428 RepID=A0A9P8C795_9HELO|nr:PQ loop repeat-domain-containing protein [Amylocarpus encephaloides]
MFPPAQTLNLDITAISGICGSVSIACWVVVFSPQIIEQFRRGSADGLSLQFIIVWLAGDIFNILGAVLQGVLPTMIILAIYYTLADIVLLLQCFYYRGFTWHDEVIPPAKPAHGATSASQLGEPNERTGLLSPPVERERRSSFFSDEASHLSPAVPLQSSPAPPTLVSTTRLQATLFNIFSIVMVCAAGVFGWYISERSQSPQRHPKHPSDNSLGFNLWGQIFGYFCAVLYLGSRVPQLLLNYRRKSTSGVSMLFFLFACIGNLTYVLSIFAYEPHCSGKHGNCAPGAAARLYGQYIGVNASWLAGSLGTLFLDLGIFAQFFVYREQGEDDSGVES